MGAFNNVVRGLVVCSLFLLAGCDESKPGSPAAESKSQVLDLNSATAAELETLPGIGAVLANRIVMARPFAAVEDLLNVPGIDEQAFQEMKPRLAVR